MSVPRLSPLAKNWTDLILPSGSEAVAEMLTGDATLRAEPVAGAVTDTTGGCPITAPPLPPPGPTTLTLTLEETVVTPTLSVAKAVKTVGANNALTTGVQATA